MSNINVLSKRWIELRRDRPGCRIGWHRSRRYIFCVTVGDFSAARDRWPAPLASARVMARWEGSPDDLRPDPRLSEVPG